MEREAFIKAIQDDPADAAVKLVFADWLSEAGEDDLAVGFRWAGRYGHHPLLPDYMKTWVPWRKNKPQVARWRRRDRNKKAGETDQLPFIVFDAIHPYSRDDRDYVDFEEAFRALGKAIKFLQRIAALA